MLRNLTLQDPWLGFVPFKALRRALAIRPHGRTFYQAGKMENILTRSSHSPRPFLGLPLRKSGEAELERCLVGVDFHSLQLFPCAVNDRWLPRRACPLALLNLSIAQNQKGQDVSLSCNAWGQKHMAGGGEARLKAHGARS